jgi:hypothetical protein
MRKRFFVIGVAVIAALVLVVPMASADNGPQPLSPDQAQSLISGPGVVTVGPIRQVSARDVIAAAAAAGATTAVQPGLTLQQAVGVGPVVPHGPALGTVAAAAAVRCWSDDMSASFGWWPYEQNLHQTAYWCAVFDDHITAYSVTTYATGSLCGTSWAQSQFISGGVGYSWFTIQSLAGWNCPTAVPWITLHPSHWMNVARNDQATDQINATG